MESNNKMNLQQIYIVLVHPLSDISPVTEIFNDAPRLSRTNHIQKSKSFKFVNLCKEFDIR